MRSRGFSLIELLISLALAGVVVGGALQLHVAYNGQSARQTQIADMQQSLRVSMQILERSIRSAGSGMLLPGPAVPGPTPLYTAGVMFCGDPNPTKLYAFQFWNNNNFPAPYTTSPITNDSDPDYFKVIAAQPDNATATAYVPASSVVTVAGPLTGWAIGDLVLFLRGTPPTPGNGVPTSCLRTITNVSGQQLTFAAPGAPLGCNPSGADTCLVSNSLPSAPSGSNNDVELKHFVNEVVYRVIPAASASDTPKLALRQAPIGDVNVAQNGWMPIADNIEDMQIAMIMSDGGVCNSVDDPGSLAQNCDPTQALAVRVTLVARSTNTIAGNPPAPKGGFEDEPMTTPNDGYLRRSMTTEINLRN